MSPDVRNGLKPPLVPQNTTKSISIEMTTEAQVGRADKDQVGRPFPSGCCISSHPVKTGPKLVLRASRAHDLLGEPSQCFVTLRAALLPLYSRGVSAILIEAQLLLFS